MSQRWCVMCGVCLIIFIQCYQILKRGERRELYIVSPSFSLSLLFLSPLSLYLFPFSPSPFSLSLSLLSLPLLSLYPLLSPSSLALSLLSSSLSFSLSISSPFRELYSVSPNFSLSPLSLYLFPFSLPLLVAPLFKKASTRPLFPYLTHPFPVCDVITKTPPFTSEDQYMLAGQEHRTPSHTPFRLYHCVSFILLF